MDGARESRDSEENLRGGGDVWHSTVPLGCHRRGHLGSQCISDMTSGEILKPSVP